MFSEINGGRGEIPVHPDSAELQGPERLWASCYYPWLDNGWIECACGQSFHSRRGSPATAQHAQHVTEVPHE